MRNLSLPPLLKRCRLLHRLHLLKDEGVATRQLLLAPALPCRIYLFLSLLFGNCSITVLTHCRL